MKQQEMHDLIFVLNIGLTERLGWIEMLYYKTRESAIELSLILAYKKILSHSI